MPANPRPKPSAPFRDVRPGVVLQPRSQRRFQQGIAAVVDAIRPTLGPFPRLVAISRSHAGESPELLDDGGLIARRIVAISDRDADMGAMFVRHVLWRLHEDVGDGTVTAAVMLKTIFDEGLKHIAAGGNAMRLREALEALLPSLLDELSRMSIPIQGQEALTQFARSICPDSETVDLLGEIFDVIGENGHLEIENARGQHNEREYIEGAFWESGLAARAMFNDPRSLTVPIVNAIVPVLAGPRSVPQRRGNPVPDRGYGDNARLENSAILITDLEINSAQALLPVLQIASDAGITALAILARKFSEDATALLLNTNHTGRLAVIGIKTPGTGTTDQFANMQDLAVLTGGRIILLATGKNLENIHPDDFGQARRIWADPECFGIVGGKADPLALRQQIASLEKALNASDSTETRRKLRARIGRLNGGAARLLVGGRTESEQKHRREQAERASLVMRAALRDGVLPGAGAAFLACRTVLSGRGTALCPDSELPQDAARRILRKALEQPSLTIAANAGYEINSLPPGLGFNVLTGQPADMLAAGILDAAGVLKAALISAVKGAALALTVDVLIHHANPLFSAEP